MVESRTNQQVGYILRSYPRLSQTFILNEILALEQAGVAIRIFAMTDPQEELVQPQVQQIRARVDYLTPPSGESLFENLREHWRVFWKHPGGYLSGLAYTLRRPQIDQGYTASSRLVCFHMAVSLADRLDQAKQEGHNLHHLHAHFAHDPAFVAHLVHTLIGVPYSFTAHARDLYQVPKTVLFDRIHKANAVVTCCQSNLKYLLEVAPEEQAKFNMIYHGVNLQSFHPPARPAPKPQPPLILSVGRLVEKKGYFDLIAALQKVKECGVPFRCQIYGEGPLQAAISQQIVEHGLTDQVMLAGICTQQKLLSVFQSASVFVLTPTVTEDGDRDGIPNVLVEAMAVGLPVISTRVAGIPELITHDRNGLLYQPHDVDGVAEGLIELLTNETRRSRLAAAARPRVIEAFDLSQAAGQLKSLFAQAWPEVEISELSRAERWA